MIIHQNVPPNPKLLDKVVYVINSRLLSGLPWLNNTFGQAFMINTNEGDFPACFGNNSEYVSMLPDEQYGNYCFHDFYDPQEYDNTVIGNHKIIVKSSIVFWFKLTGGDKLYNVESMKKQILDILAKPGLLREGKISVLKIYQKPENIFSKYKINQKNNQMLMFPYAGLRIDCSINIDEKCYM